MRSIFNRLIPFIFMGIALVAFTFGIVLLAYLFFFGAILGFILFLINWVRNKFFTPKTTIPRKGQTIDSDDWKVL